MAATSQNLTLNALVIFYARELEKPLGKIGETIHAKRPPRLRVLLSHSETLAIAAVSEGNDGGYPCRQGGVIRTVAEVNPFICPRST